MEINNIKEVTSDLQRGILSSKQNVENFMQGQINSIEENSILGEGAPVVNLKDLS